MSCVWLSRMMMHMSWSAAQPARSSTSCTAVVTFMPFHPVPLGVQLVDAVEIVRAEGCEVVENVAHVSSSSAKTVTLGEPVLACT